jgi:4-hydroxythreonine-4-phosphate dehydrogenase
VTVSVAITLGDPRGVGPEVTEAALRSFRSERPDVSIALFGGAGDGTEAGAGRVSGAAIEDAVAAALAGRVHAIVTAPIHKPALARAGYGPTGHTELLQRLTGAPAVGMLLAAERTELGPPLRVLLATTHHALRDVPDLISADLLVEQTTLLRTGLREGWGIAEPRIGLCALNPHASDGGLFGDEEARVYAPALQRLRANGAMVTGPFPADTVFRRALDGRLDAVVAPYHDVAMAAFKTLAFKEGVNVTLGLPFVRTSPDHGTAFDIAGQGKADPSSMLAALRLAARLAEKRFDTSPHLR